MHIRVVYYRRLGYRNICIYVVEYSIFPVEYSCFLILANRNENERFHLWFFPAILIWVAMVLKKKAAFGITQNYLYERSRDFHFLSVAPICLVVLNLIPRSSHGSFFSSFENDFCFSFFNCRHIHSTTESSNGNITNGKTSVNIIWLMKESRSARADFYR